MPVPGLFGFCADCQHLIAPPLEACPGCHARMAAVKVEDLREEDSQAIQQAIVHRGAVAVRLKDVGSHAALIEEGGLYARLAALQFDTSDKGGNETTLPSGD